MNRLRSGTRVPLTRGGRVRACLPAVLLAVLVGTPACRPDQTADPGEAEEVAAVDPGPRRSAGDESANGDDAGLDTTGATIPGGDTIPARTPAADSLLALVPDAPALGPDAATVVLIEFSDFECPFCARAHDTVDRFVRERDGARLLYVHYPIPALHPRAVLAAEAAVEAQRQGKFWEYHAALFEHGPPLDREALLEVAEEVDLDVAAMGRALRERHHRERVAQEMELGERLGITGTPTFFINGYRLVGAQPYESFVTIYNLLLRASRREELADAVEGSGR